VALFTAGKIPETGESVLKGEMEAVEYRRGEIFVPSSLSM
jgi:hypothetical protein